MIAKPVKLATAPSSDKIISGLHSNYNLFVRTKINFLVGLLWSSRVICSP